MSKRTLFYGLALRDAGSATVESLRSFIERLALAHSFRPRALLETLLAADPLDGIKENLLGLFKRWDIHGMSGIGVQLRDRLERATGTDLTAASLARFGPVFAQTHLAHTAYSRHCPECVREGPDLPHGQLLWEVACVTACPKHGLRLRSSKECGAEASKRLTVGKRPGLSSVCAQCGSVGFRCLTAEPEEATAAEVWIAQQVGRLLALPSSRVAEMTPATVQAGLKRVVEHCYDGSVVKASREAGLARASVCEWSKGNGKPSLALLMQLCHHARADIVALIEGRYERLATNCTTGHSLELVRRDYVRTPLSWDEIREALLAAAKEENPPGVAAVAERLGVNERLMALKLPVESVALTEVNKKHRYAQFAQQYTEAVAIYEASAAKLQELGIPITSKYLQRHSRLVAFSQNTARVRALAEAIERFNGSGDGRKAA